MRIKIWDLPADTIVQSVDRRSDKSRASESLVGPISTRVCII